METNRGVEWYKKWHISGIINGSAWTKGDEDTLNDLGKWMGGLQTSEDIDYLLNWIRENIRPRKTPNKMHTSYGLKHIFEESERGFYVTNNQFKDAMLTAGFAPVDPNRKNWWYCISEKSPCFYQKSRYDMSAGNGLIRLSDVQSVHN